MRVAIFLIALSLTGCSDFYRYPCQDPANKDNPECNRPICEAEGMCYDMLNGLPPPAATTVVEEETPAAAPCEQSVETTGE